MPEEHGKNTQNPAPDPVDRIKPYQWKPGQSGNPGGRPKNESIVSLLRRVLEQEHHGRPLKEILAERLVKEALAGKHAFVKELLDRVEGPVNQKQEVKQDNTVRILVTDGRGNEREGTNDDLRAMMAPTREVGSLREFDATCPARPPAGGDPTESTHGV